MEVGNTGTRKGLCVPLDDDGLDMEATIGGKERTPL